MTNRDKNTAKLLTVCGTVLFFIVGMYKVLVPQAVHADLIRIYLTEDLISWLGAGYMYAYAVSQITTGPLTDRFGGVRVMLGGSLLFIVGAGIFPFCTGFTIALSMRLVSGFGAGMIFTGLARMVAENFPKTYTTMLSAVIGLSFFGPTFGTMPAYWTISKLGWQWALQLPILISLTAFIPAAAAFFLHPSRPSHAIQTKNNANPLNIINWDFILICLSSAPLFGVYYVLLTQLGPSPLVELCRMQTATASACIMTMTILVAVLTLACGLIQRICARLGRHLITIVVAIGTIGVFAVAFDSLTGFHNINFSLFVFIVCLIIPAGAFPLFSNAVRQAVPAENIGSAVAFLNFTAFVAIALCQNIAGKIITATGEGLTGAKVYTNIFTFCAIAAAISMCAALIFSLSGKNKQTAS